jgi:cobalamin biosynthesis protein CobD/CbiB
MCCCAKLNWLIAHRVVFFGNLASRVEDIIEQRMVSQKREMGFSSQFCAFSLSLSLSLAPSLSLWLPLSLSLPLFCNHFFFPLHTRNKETWDVAERGERAKMGVMEKHNQRMELLPSSIQPPYWKAEMCFRRGKPKMVAAVHACLQ